MPNDLAEQRRTAQFEVQRPCVYGLNIEVPFAVWVFLDSKPDMICGHPGFDIDFTQPYSGGGFFAPIRGGRPVAVCKSMGRLIE